MGCSKGKGGKSGKMSRAKAARIVFNSATPRMTPERLNRAVRMQKMAGESRKAGRVKAKKKSTSTKRAI